MQQTNLIGRAIAGRFEIIRMIGQGGMGTVYEARHRTLPRRFALKVLRPQYTGSRDFVRRFEREAVAASRIEHPNVVYITDFGRTDDGLLYLVMEYLQGAGLDEVLSRTIRLPLNRVLSILAQLADALHCAHDVDVVHRDLKPENILLTEVRGKRDVVKVLDFGIAKVRMPDRMEETLTRQGQVFGTAEYMSPEQATGDPVDGRSDIYALGCLAYEMITGNPPFVGRPVEVLQAHVHSPVLAPSVRLRDYPVPSSIDALVLRCLAKEPADRYQSGNELLQSLMRCRGALLGARTKSATGEACSVGLSATRSEMISGWHSIGGEVPDLFADEGGSPAPVVADVEQSVAPRHTSVEELRDRYNDVLREVTLGLVQSALASRETSEALDRLLLVEEEAASLTGTIALAEQNFDRIRFDYSQREKRLREAVLDLSTTRAQLLGRTQADPQQREKLQGQIRDLEYQIGELKNRCAEIAEECAEEIGKLDHEVKSLRQAQQERDAEAAALYESLRTKVEALRPRASTSAELLALYRRLDAADNATATPSR